MTTLFCEHSNSHLFKWDTPGKQLDEISGSDDGIGVKRFLCGAHCDASLNKVQRSFDVLKTNVNHVTQIRSSAVIGTNSVCIYL